MRLIPSRSQNQLLLESPSILSPDIHLTLEREPIYEWPPNSPLVFFLRLLLNRRCNFGFSMGGGGKSLLRLFTALVDDSPLCDGSLRDVCREDASPGVLDDGGGWETRFGNFC